VVAATHDPKRDSNDARDRAAHDRGWPNPKQSRYSPIKRPGKGFWAGEGAVIRACTAVSASKPPTIDESSLMIKNTIYRRRIRQ
jgi:hypothetical protein